MTRSLRGIALPVVLAALFAFAPAAHAIPGYEFAEWTDSDGTTTNGFFQGRPITLTGEVHSSANVYDNSFTRFGGEWWTPRLAKSDVIEIVGLNGRTFTLDFRGPVTDPIIHLYTLASTLAFPPGTVVTKLSGQDTFTVSGNTVSGVLAGQDDSSGTIQLSGTFSSLTFSATPTFSGGTIIDGIGVNVGVPVAGPQTSIVFFSNQLRDGGYPGFITTRVHVQPEGVETRCVIDPPTVPAGFDDLPPEQCPLLSPASRTVDTPGVHTIYAGSRDATGTTEAIISRQFTIFPVPETVILNGPRGETWDSTPEFKFASNLPDATFECRYDSAPFAPCRSPHAVPVAPGDHTFTVRAVGRGGGFDRTPPTRSFTVRTETTKGSRCRVQPVFVSWITLTNDGSLLGCRVVRPPHECKTADSGIVCAESRVMVCPRGTRCTVTATVRFYDADEVVNWRAQAEVGNLVGITDNGMTLAGHAQSISVCATGYEGDRCTTRASWTVLGDDTGLFGDCRVLPYFDTVIPGRYKLGPHSVRRLECDVDVRIAEAATLVPVVSPQAIASTAPGPGTLTIALSIITGRSPRAAAAKPAIATVKKTVADAGPVSLPLKLNAAAKALLKLRKKLTVQVKSTFAPVVGKAVVKTSRITIEQPKPKPKECKNPRKRC